MEIMKEGPSPGMDAINQENKVSLVLVLTQSILSQLSESGATEEEALAALKSAEAIVPVLNLLSRSNFGARL